MLQMGKKKMIFTLNGIKNPIRVNEWGLIVLVKIYFRLKPKA